MIQLAYPKVGFNRNHHRIWLQGLNLGLANFTVHAGYRIEQDAEKRTVTLIRDDKNPDRHVSRKRRSKNSDDYVPLIDLNDTLIGEYYGAYERVRTLIFKDRVVISVHHLDARQEEALQSLIDNLNEGLLTKGTLFAGGGISDRAISEGVEMTGLVCRTEYLLDLEGGLLQVAASNSPSVTESTMMVVGDINEVEVDLLPRVNLLALSMPCVGHSKSGKAKNGISSAEEHPAGSAFLGTLDIIKSSGAAMITGENVPEYAGSLTDIVVKMRLKQLGYTIHEEVMAGEDFGALENRKRHIWVAVLKGLEFAMDMIRPLSAKPANMRSIMSDVPNDSAMWKNMDYLAAKELRDKAAGKNFARQIIDPSNTSVGSAGAGYYKIRSTEPMWQHPENPDLYRLYTTEEHERVKTVPNGHTDGFDNKRAHMVLGNGVIYSLFVSLGVAMGECAKIYAGLAPSNIMSFRKPQAISNVASVSEVTQVVRETQFDLFAI